MSRNSKRSAAAALPFNVEREVLAQRYFRSLRNGVAVASLGTLGLLSQPAYGANATWIGNTDPNYATVTNWSVFPFSGDSLIFGDPGTAGTLLADNLMTPPTYLLSQITFNAGARPTQSMPRPARVVLPLELAASRTAVRTLRISTTTSRSTPPRR